MARHEAELKELAALSEQHGFSEDDLLVAWREQLFGPKAKTGPPASMPSADV